MAELLKNMYNPIFFESLNKILKKHVPDFKERDFIHLIYDKQWPDLELKQRVRHITHALHHFFPSNFEEASCVVKELARQFQKNMIKEQSFELMFLADYIEVYGISDYYKAMETLEVVTQVVSGEFAIRPFLIRYPELCLKQLLEWSRNNNANVRRLASEGCRPQLPWASRVSYLKKEPQLILPILENLKDDISVYVRRSVANNLNDIAKDHPGLVLEIAKKWSGQSSNTDWVIKHACRTLFKKGNADALSLHGFEKTSKADINNFELADRKVKIGNQLQFILTFQNQERSPAKFRLEYAIDYLTATGKVSRKIFKLAEKMYLPFQVVELKRKQSFKDFTTRKHYKGKHLISIIVNGNKQAQQEFIVC